MPQEGIPGYLKYRVIDPNSANIIAQDLPHLHPSTWTVRTVQRSFPGSTTIGDFHILLPAPYSEEGRKYRDLFNTLAERQKVEAYLGDVITGSPKFSGVITKIRKPLNAPWEISGSDTLWWLQQSQTLQGEVIPGSLSPAQLVGRFMTTQETVWDDDFSNWSGGSSPPHNSADYTNTGNIWTITTDPTLGPGFAALQDTSTVSPAILTSNTSWNVGAEYEGGGNIVIAGTIVAGTDTTLAGEAAILALADSNAQNGVQGRVYMYETGAGSGFWNVGCSIHSISGGVFTLQSQNATVFTNVSNLLVFELTMVIYQDSSSRAVFKMLLNGKDAGVSYTTLTPPASGRIGIRSFPAAAGGPVCYVDRLQFHTRTRQGVATRFAQGSTFTQSTVTLGPDLSASGQTHLDLIGLATVLDGFFVRKTPGAGPRADVLDYGANPGTDLSSSIVFEEGVNIEAEGTLVGPAADLLADLVKLQAAPGVDSGGIAAWARIGNLGDMILSDVVYDLGIPTFKILLNYARQVQARKTSPNVATQLTVVRTADTVEKWRELDDIQVQIPSLNINHQKQRILGYTFTEGDTKQTVWLSQFPEQTLPQAGLQRLVRTLDFLSALFQSR